MEIKEYQSNFYILDNQKVREFLIIGENHAVLIDTGFPDDHIIEYVQKLTDKPIQVVLTHGDMDHVGGLNGFQECQIHEKDASFIQTDIKVSFVQEGDMINIGDYSFEIIEIPGHSYGSIALFDRKKGLFLSGDTVQKGPIFMFGKHRDLDLYIQSLKKLMVIKDEIHTILPSHNQYPLSSEYISYCLEDAIALRNNELKGTPHPHMPCVHYVGKNTEFYYEL